MSKGKVVVLEGLDGSGKGTQHKLLVRALQELGFDIVTKDFPDYDTPSGQVVKQYLNGELSQNPYAISYKQASVLFAVNRLMVYQIELKEKHEAGSHMVLDRYSTSNWLYQGAKINLGRLEAIEWLRRFEHEELELPYPDQVIYLDVPGRISKELLQVRYKGDETKKDIHERDLDYQHEARNTGLLCAREYGWSIVHCGKPGYEEILESSEFATKRNFSDVLRSIEDIHEEVLKETVKVLRR